MPDFLVAEAAYTVKVKAVLQNNEMSELSEEAEFETPEPSECCVWKECPDNIVKHRRYFTDKKNTRIATDNCYHCTISGNTALPLNRVTSWSIKILKSKDNNGYGIFIGVAPSDINQNEGGNYKNCGWYFYCLLSALWSGPPHNFENKGHGPRKYEGEYVHTGRFGWQGQCRGHRAKAPALCSLLYFFPSF